MMEPIRPEIRVEESTPRFGRIIVEPLERGFGVTLGNALRRVLLSSVRGAAISAVRVEGVLHEFSTIPGVREDVIELVMNLKHVPVRCYAEDEFRILRLEAQGPCQVTASHIEADSEVEFVDPEAYICELEEGARLAMDLYVEQGVGYAPNDRPRPAYLPLDSLPIDALYSPVERVKYEVQAARVGQRTDYDSLVLEIWTNGVVTPEEAVAESSQILKGYFSQVASDLGRPVTVESAQEPEGESDEIATPLGEEDAFLARPVRDLELSIRSENCLLRGGILTIGDLVGRSRDDLLKIRNLGKISLREIEEKLEKAGLSLISAETEKETKEE
jgi:DNA-directed RNA polymerase subunit alpha